MSAPGHGASDPPTASVIMSSVEKLACEWEARHDVAARGRQVDPAATLRNYLSHIRCEEELCHQDHPAHPSRSDDVRRERDADRFTAEHPLAASWVRWGENPH